MKIPFSLLFAIILSLDTFAAPVPNAQVGDDFALEVRKAKVAAKKPVKAPVKAKPVAKPKPKPVAKKPVAKKPVAKPVAKKPVAKPAAKKPVAKPAAKKPAAKPAAKKPAAKPVAPKKPAAKPAAKKPVAKPAAKKPATTAAKKPVAKPAAKKPATTAAKPVAKPAAKKPATTVAKKPVAKPAAKKPATTAAKKPVAKPAAKKPATAAAKKPVAAKKPAAKTQTKTTAKAPAKSAVKPAASACPIKPAAKKTATKAVKAKAKRMLDTVTRKARIANRTFFGLIQPRLTSGNEFVGWHGTNEETAALWEKSGEIVRPTTKEGQTKGKSGLDAELGPGLYISDTLGVAESAAAINAQTNKLAGKVCAIFAKSSSSFRASQDKVQIPEIIRGNANVKEQERASYITNLTPRGTGSGASLRIGPLPDLKGQPTNQMLIPESQNPKFEAQCFDTVGLDSADAAAFEKSNGAIKYTSASLISEWKFRKEDADLAKATVAAIEKKCP